MDSTNGGPTSSERQRQTAAEIARRQVLASYSSAKTHNITPSPTSANKYKQAPINTNQKNDEWRKYHSAWQSYYQKYYSDYYAKAARSYIQAEKLKEERKRKDNERLGIATQPVPKQQIFSSDQPIVSQPEVVEESLREKIRKKATDAASKSRKHRHLIPILAGVSAILLILFLQYNRLIFAPIMAYVSPGNTTDTGITAVDPTVATAPGPEPKLIIPKLNIDVPVHFGISNDTATVMDAMNNGVAQFSIPGANAMPGQIGNLVITGHSAGDIYSNNQYKFIFSGLERLQVGDTIYINYESKRYTYSVTKFETVEPSDVSALIYTTDKPMLTLITCTPLGTSRYRLLVTAEQIDPVPDASNIAVDQGDATASPDASMPSNTPSFFKRIWNWLTNQSE